MTLPRPLLLVGFSPALLDFFGRLLPEGAMVILEEPDAARKRDAHPAAERSTACRALVIEEYLLPGGADRFYLRNADLDPIAVIPSHDYAVPAAARLAERYGVPGASLGAAEILRDKHLLRVVTGAAGIANPVSRPVTSAADVLALRSEVDGPVIIKPANRQAAIGTAKVYDVAEIETVWQQCLEHQSESCLPDREPELRMLAEQLVDGPEYSVEMLYANGKRYFANVTAKVLLPGPRPVELGHLVPAPVDEELTELLAAQTERVLAAVGFGAGMAHCEWIVQDGVPYLVECAGRQPGDFILELVQSAYDFDFFHAYLELMRGGEPDCPRGARGGAATWHGTAEPGVVISIDGVAEAAALAGVNRCSVTVHAGDTVKPVASSWDRTAVVTAAAGTATEAAELAQRAIGLLRIETKPR